MPAFSISFFESAEVTQILSAGWSVQSFAAIAFAYGLVFNRVIMTPFVSDY